MEPYPVPTDGENNKTSYVYDGFDRLQQTQYPSPTKGAGTSNPSDYEQLGYDANSNVVSRRLRDGQTIGHVDSQYDLAGRKTRTTWGDGFYVSYERLVTGDLSKVRENGASSGAWECLPPTPMTTSVTPSP